MRTKLTKTELGSIKKKAVCSWGFGFLNIRALIHSDDQKIIDIFKNTYGNFSNNNMFNKSIACYILTNSIIKKQQSCIVIDNYLINLPSKKNLIEQAEQVIIQSIIEIVEHHFLIHAGVVAKNNECVILIGPSLCGKSTLVHELVRRNYKFLSDECCAVRFKDFLIEPFPRNINIRDNSPALKSIPNKFKNIKLGNKYIINPNTIYPHCLGSAGTAKYLIKINSLCDKASSAEKNNIINVMFFRQVSEFVEEICNEKRIILKETTLNDNLVCYRFLVPEKDGLIKHFQDVCKKYKNVIYQVVVDSNNCFNFSTSPIIKPLSRADAAFEIIRNLVNRTLHSRLFDQYNDKMSNLLFTISKFVSTIDCFELTPGNLDKTADMIDNLYMKGVK